jgi:hypothetical protein
MEYIKMLLKLLREQLERLENYLDMNRSNFLRELVRSEILFLAEKERWQSRYKIPSVANFLLLYKTITSFRQKTSFEIIIR